MGWVAWKYLELNQDRKIVILITIAVLHFTSLDECYSVLYHEPVDGLASLSTKGQPTGPQVGGEGDLRDGSNSMMSCLLCTALYCRPHMLLLASPSRPRALLYLLELSHSHSRGVQWTWTLDILIWV